MRGLSREQFLTVFGLSSGGFDAQQRAGHVALAFGTPIPATPGRYFDLPSRAAGHLRPATAAIRTGAPRALATKPQLWPNSCSMANRTHSSAN
jgi:hypothetical protein